MTMRKSHTSTVPVRMLKWLLPEHDRETLYYTYLDLYSIERDERGSLFALFWVWFQIIKSLPGFFSYTIYWRILMIKSYLKIAMRHIMRQKVFTFINVSGLALGMAVCMLIMLWIMHELSFDRFHENANEIYRITEEQVSSNGNVFPVTVTPWPLAEALKEEYPEIIESTRLRILERPLFSLGDKQFYEDGLVAVDPSFLKMFSFPFINGDSETVISSPSAIAISERLSDKYFGSENPIGKTFKAVNYDQEFTVSGVFENVPENSHVQFEMLVQFESTLKSSGWSTNWSNNNYQTYVQVSKGTDIIGLEEKISTYMIDNQNYTRLYLRIQSLLDIHLHSNYAIDIYGHTEDTSVYIYIFSIIALFVLLIACLNFINLSTARSENRAKEVGLRKTVGAKRTDIISQFYGESLILTFIALSVSFLMVYLFLPAFNEVSGKTLSIKTLIQPGLFSIIVFTTIIVGIMSGSYPALVQSSIKPTRILKGLSAFSGGRIRGSMMRKILVVLQFIISIAIIAGTLSVYKQIQYMQSMKLGYQKEHIIYFSKQSEIQNQFSTFKDELLKNPAITSITSSSDVPTYTVHSTYGVGWEGKDPDASLLIHQFSVDYDYLSTFQMELAEGRDFSREHTTDARNGAFILNETAIKAMNMENPIGKKFRLWDIESPIIGVVKDFHFKSLHERIEPLVLRIDSRWQSYTFIKVKSENIDETLASIEKVHKSFLPEYPFQYKFLDEAVGNLYNEEKRTNTILGFFTFISLFISSLGLFGMAAFTAQKRTKEIGIRKVLGASTPNIVYLLTREFALLIGIANVVAWPMAYYGVSNWLESFAYRTDTGWIQFLVSGIAALLVALIVTSYQAAKAASANPAETIRHE